MASNNLMLIIASIMNTMISKFDERFPGNYFISRAPSVFERQITACIAGPVYSNPNLGTFGRQFDPRVCISSPCTPMSPDLIGVMFILSVRNDIEANKDANAKDGAKAKSGAIQFQDYFLNYNDAKSRGLIKSNKVVIGVHGWFEDYKIGAEQNRTRDGWLKMGADYITVDWSGGNVEFSSSAANARVVGALLGQMIAYLNIASITECVGFSQGAHVCGFAGQWLKERHLTTIASCTGLDPGGNLFEGCPACMRLSSDDCAVVKVVHVTYAMTGQPQAFGIKEKSGKCDYYLNYGRSFNDCMKQVPLRSLEDVQLRIPLRSDEIVLFFEKIIACNHLKARVLYNDQLFSSVSNRLTAKLCQGPSYDCNYNITSDREGSDISILPPFDECKQSMNEFNACGCL